MDEHVPTQLNLESIDLPRTKGVVANRVQTTNPQRVRCALYAYPFRFHWDEKNLQETIINREKKGVTLIGLHHEGITLSVTISR